MTPPPVIGLLSDFGTRDWYVAAMRGVILSHCPTAQLIDITHEIPPQDVVAGALVLSGALPWLPRGAVVVALVDPGVGSRRVLLAAQVDGRYLVGPDNGLLALSLQQATRTQTVRLTRSRYWLPAVSRTFHGRDILAPVAAHLASGVALSRLGVRVRRVAPLELPSVRRRGQQYHGEVVHIDGFGNLVTNLPGSLLARGRALVHYRNQPVRAVGTYAEARVGELIALVGSVGLIELALRNHSAAQRVAALRGERIVLQVQKRR